MASAAVAAPAAAAGSGGDVPAVTTPTGAEKKADSVTSGTMAAPMTLATCPVCVADTMALFHRT